jgi:hypothetical protein
LSKNLAVFCDHNRTWKHGEGKDHNKHVLVSWIQLRCQRCKRFLSKRQLKYCDRCEKLGYLERNNAFFKSAKGKEANTRAYYKNREEKLLRANVYYNAERYEVGQIV